MSYNGNGVWVRLYSWTQDAQNGIKIRADRMDAEFNDMCANGLSAVITRDGQGKPTANTPWNSFKITGLAAGTSNGDALSYGQSQVAILGNATAVFGTTGTGLIGNAYTQTDNVTGAGTVAAAYASTLGAVTFATASNAITITNAYGLYLKDPVAGANTTLSNKSALGTDSFKNNGLTDISGASAGQIKFPSTQNASANANTLDDYAETPFTPVLTFGGGNTGMTNTLAQGKFTKIGDRVFFDMQFSLSARGSSTGNAIFTASGMPVPSNTASRNMPVQLWVQNVSAGASKIFQGIVLNNTGAWNLVLYVVDVTTSTVAANATQGNLSDTAVFYISGQYGV